MPQISYVLPLFVINEKFVLKKLVTKEDPCDFFSLSFSLIREVKRVDH